MNLSRIAKLGLYVAIVSGSAWLVPSTRTVAQDRLTAESLVQLNRIGEAAVSMDGHWLAYTVSTTNLEENSATTDLIVAELPHGGSEAEASAAAFLTPQLQLSNVTTVIDDGKGIGSLSWITRGDDNVLLFTAPGPDMSDAESDEEEAQDPSTDGDSSDGDSSDAVGSSSDDSAEGDVSEQMDGPPQIWAWISGDESPRMISKLEEGVSGLKIAPSGDRIAFNVDVKLDETVQELYEDLPHADARIIDSLLYRHWNQWHDYKYTHVFVAELTNDLEVVDPRDLMPEMRADCPVPPFGGSEQFNFSPDGKEIALTIKLVNNPAESTDTSVFLTTTHQAGKLRNITPNMPGYDMEANYSPDGRWIAFQSMERASFEADRNRIMLYDRSTGSIKDLTEGLDQTTHNIRWCSDSEHLYFDSETAGTQQVYEISVPSGRLRQISSGTFDFHVVTAIPEHEMVLATQSSMLRANELALIDVDSGKVATLTDVNQEFFDGIDLPTVTERWVTASDGASIHNWVITPPDFDPTKKYPLLVYCQGGPQGQIGQWFSSRWNFHLMAAKGYVVIAVNRRGLPGFGRKWNDDISGDWGGQAMRDILAATDSMLAEPYVDTKRVGAVGASFGGYTVYWLMGNSDDRFSAMIAHCGVFNLESMYGSTEELFFVNWDLRGPYWSSESTQQLYDRFSPHRYIQNWKTPLLVIHGEKDFRVPVTQGMEAFTAAQVQGVESRFLYFPDEGHWVLQPQNGVLWARIFYDWLDRHLGETE